jgi:hypothetical protein
MVVMGFRITHSILRFYMAGKDLAVYRRKIFDGARLSFTATAEREIAMDVK